MKINPVNLKYAQWALTVIETEANAISQLNQAINDDFDKACDLILACSGRVVVMGMGKSGHISKKIAATLASTGTPAFYVHPGEANHGDFGMITKNDIALLLSYSGETQEILNLMPFLKHMKVPIIAITGKKGSNLAKMSDIVLNASIDSEACPLGLAPTASTTAALVLGDALAMTLLQARGFTAQDFAFSHPGGQLGKRLLLKVKDIMQGGQAVPKVQSNATVSQAILEISQKGLGCTTVVDAQNKILGIYTDGDLRRTIDKNLNIHDTLIKDVMTINFKSINSNDLAIKALEMMQSLKITTLVVLDQQNDICGLLHIHALLHSGIV